MKAAILLPGLDGSGQMFAPLIELISEHFECRVISFPSNEQLTYEDLAELVKAQLPRNGDFIIIAESFSGPIAYALSLDPPTNLKCIIFGASFLENPNKLLLKFLYLIPTTIKMAAFFPSSLLNRILFAGKLEPDLILCFKIIINNSPGKLLFHRLKLLVGLSLPHTQSRINAICIEPYTDYLVTKAGFESISKRFTNISRFDVAGTHFVFQTNPADCASVIINETKSL